MKNILIAVTIALALLAGGCGHKQTEQEKFFANANAQIAEAKSAEEKAEAAQTERSRHPSKLKIRLDCVRDAQIQYQNPSPARQKALQACDDIQ